MDLRPRRTIKAPKRYEDEVESSSPHPQPMISMTKRQILNATTPAFEIPFVPFNPTTVRDNPAAFPTRDVGLNWGLLEAQSRATKKPLFRETGPSNGHEAQQYTSTQLPQEMHRKRRSFTTEEVRLLTPKTNGLRAILPTSRKRSDSAIKSPRQKKPKVSTVCRRQPPPNPALGNNIPFFATSKAYGQRLEEVWNALGRNSPSFLNQAVNAPPHGLRNLIKDLRSHRDLNSLRDKPSRPNGPFGNLLGVHYKGRTSVSTEAHNAIRPRSALYQKPVEFANFGPEETARWRRSYGTGHTVNTEAGPFYNPEFVDEEFLANAATSDDEKSPESVSFSGIALARFDDLAVQLAVDIYCHIYFEAEALGADGKTICRILLDLTTKSDEHMHWVLAKRLGEKFIDTSAPNPVPEVYLEREVLPDASPSVSNFPPPHDRRQLARRNVDWNYVSTADLQKAEAFLRALHLPDSLLCDWNSQHPITTPSSLHARQELDSHEQTPEPPESPTIPSRPRSRKRKTPLSDAEYQPASDAEAEADHPDDAPSDPRSSRQPTASSSKVARERPQPLTQQPIQRRHNQHVPPRPSFARPGASVARATRDGPGWRAQLERAVAEGQAGDGERGRDASEVGQVGRGRGRPQNRG
ncbi:MAG: hypothetical protein M1821_008224 [Bathelium mastoideum]|nr:MAG: hypothetical protein M1821_008224 [Bathelium mastoideum]